MDIEGPINVPDSKMVADATDLARGSLEPYLFNHVMRSWLFAAELSNQATARADPELLAVASLLHDLGLADRYTTDGNRFEVDGANAARDFLQTYSLAGVDIQLVWDAIALHTTGSIALHKGPVVALCHSGVQVDVSGMGYDAIGRSLMNEILRRHPRLSFKQKLASRLCGIVRKKPHTTSDNFMRDFGERYVCGYASVSSVDRLLLAPFEG